MRICTSAAVATVALLALFGCGGGAPSSDERSTDRVTLPVDVRSALGRAEDRFSAVLAEQRLVARCMRRRGLPYSVTSLRDTVASDRWYRLEDAYRFGPAPDADAADFGLSANAPADADQAEDPNAAAVEAMGETERAAWFDALQGSGETMFDYTDPVSGTGYGMSTDGCLAEARLELYGSFGSYVELSAYPSRLTDLVFRRVASDRRFEQAERAWAACAERHGYEMAHPAEPAGAILVALGGGVTSKIRELERRHHAMSVACEAEVPIYALGWKLTGEALPGVLADEAGNVARYRALLERAAELMRND